VLMSWRMKYSDMEVVSISLLILRKSPPSFLSGFRLAGKSLGDLSADSV
jgi:hypothetical protein